jgi:hypothetical protein
MSPLIAHKKQACSVAAALRPNRQDTMPAGTCCVLCPYPLHGKPLRSFTAIPEKRKNDRTRLKCRTQDEVRGRTGPVACTTGRAHFVDCRLRRRLLPPTGAAVGRL